MRGERLAVLTSAATGKQYSFSTVGMSASDVQAEIRGIRSLDSLAAGKAARDAASLKRTQDYYQSRATARQTTASAMAEIQRLQATIKGKRRASPERKAVEARIHDLYRQLS